MVMSVFQKQKSDSSLTDLELIAKFQATGDNNYVATLFNRYVHLIYGVTMKYLKNEEDSKDFTMQVFEILMNKLSYHQVENFKSWLYTLVRNHCLMHLRKVKSHREKDAEIKYIYEAGMENPEDWHLEDEKEILLNGLEQALSELNEEQEICIRLFYLKKKSYQEIMDETGFDFKQVKSFIQNGKRNLKNLLS
jgi:RNA polymerase sigma-70 factor, ECF subfamily